MKFPGSKFSPSTVCIALLSGLVASPPILAEQMVLEEITVTAQKRQQNLQDVPISISAVTGDQLRKDGIATTADLVFATPGLTASGSYAASNTKFSIRGISIDDFTQNFQSPVGLYIDEVYMASPSGSTFQLFDLDRVEILRGPQGSLFGRNTTGGAISVFTKRPEEELGGYAQLRLGNHEFIETEGALNLPVSDSVKLRLSGVYRERDGITENRVTGNDINNVDQYALRASLLFTPNDNFEALLTVDGGQNDNDGAQSQAVGADLMGYTDTDRDPFEGDFTEKRNDVVGYEDISFEEVDAFGTKLWMQWDLGSVLLTSVTAYRDTELERGEETDGSPNRLFEVIWTSEADQFSQELRLASADPGKMDWLVGIYYSEDSVEGSNAALFPAAPFAFNWRLEEENTSAAVFAHGTYHLSDALRITAGIRYTKESRDFSYENRFLPFSNPFGAGTAAAFSFDEDPDYSEWSGNLALSYDVNEDAMVYVSLSRGFKSGENSGLAFSPLTLQATDPEFLTSFELGLKSTLMNGRTRLNVTGFYYDYSDLIVTTNKDLGGPTVSTIRANASEADVYGAEIELQMMPTERLYAEVGIAWLGSAEYEDFESATAATDFSGNQLPIAPEWNLNGLIEYRVPFKSGELTTQLNAVYVDEQVYDAANTPLVESSGYGLLNFRLQFNDSSERYSVALWAKNLTDKEYVSEASNNTDAGNIGLFYGDPRTFGLELGIKY